MWVRWESGLYVTKPANRNVVPGIKFVDSSVIHFYWDKCVWKKSIQLYTLPVVLVPRDNSWTFCGRWFFFQHLLILRLTPYRNPVMKQVEAKTGVKCCSVLLIYRLNWWTGHKYTEWGKRVASSSLFQTYWECALMEQDLVLPYWIMLIVLTYIIRSHPCGYEGIEI